MNPILVSLLKWLAPLVAELVLIFLQRLRRQRMDDPSLLDVIDNAARHANERSDWTEHQKREYVRDTARSYGKAFGKEVKDSLINSLLELSVQKLKEREEKNP